MFPIPFIEWDAVELEFIMKEKFGIVYELSDEDFFVIEEINRNREHQGLTVTLRTAFWKLRNGKDDYTALSVCARVIKRPGFEEFYDALDKIKPFSEREIVEVRG